MSRVNTHLLSVKFPLIIALSLLLKTPVAAQLDEVLLLERDFWPQTRSGETVREIEPLRRTVEVFDSQREAHIMIQYTEGDVGNAWAFEVKEWLVAFGIEADRILLEPGDLPEQSLGLAVVK